MARKLSTRFYPKLRPIIGYGFGDRVDKPVEHDFSEADAAIEYAWGVRPEPPERDTSEHEAPEAESQRRETILQLQMMDTFRF